MQWALAEAVSAMQEEEAGATVVHPPFVVGQVKHFSAWPHGGVAIHAQFPLLLDQSWKDLGTWTVHCRKIVVQAVGGRYRMVFSPKAGSPGGIVRMGRPNEIEPPLAAAPAADGSPGLEPLPVRADRAAADGGAVPLTAGGGDGATAAGGGAGAAASGGCAVPAAAGDGDGAAAAGGGDGAAAAGGAADALVDESGSTATADSPARLPGRADGGPRAAAGGLGTGGASAADGDDAVADVTSEQVPPGVLAIPQEPNEYAAMSETM